jgi:CMP-N-acetylneuraminic acid synthetase
MKALAIILARAGSKGCPGKNTAQVGGRPCIAWTIEAAKQAKSVGAVLVSSDDPKALEIATDMGAAALPRPHKLATDDARIDDAARYAVSEWQRLWEPMDLGDAPEPPLCGDLNMPNAPIVILYANVPVRPPGLIDQAVTLLLETEAHSVQSYSPVGKHHPWWTVCLDPDGGVQPWEGAVLNNGVFRRQDLPPAYVPDGGVIALTRRALFLEVPGTLSSPHAFFGNKRRAVINKEGSVIDIDSPIDLVVADTVLRAQQ